METVVICVETVASIEERMNNINLDYFLKRIPRIPRVFPWFPRFLLVVTTVSIHLRQRTCFCTEHARSRTIIRHFNVGSDPLDKPLFASQGS